VGHALAVATPAKAEAKASAAKATAPPRKEAVPSPPAAGRTFQRLNGGTPLPPTTRQRMERSFGRSFAAVRVHHDAAAGRATAEHAAEAVAVGDQLAFAPGKYRPGTPAGDRLIAHELAHVAQDGGAGGVVHARSSHSEPGEPAEQAAEAAADRVMRGETGVLATGGAVSTRARIMRRALNGLPVAAVPLPVLERGTTAVPPPPPLPTAVRPLAPAPAPTRPPPATAAEVAPPAAPEREEAEPAEEAGRLPPAAAAVAAPVPRGAPAPPAVAVAPAEEAGAAAAEAEEAAAAEEAEKEEAPAEGAAAAPAGAAEQAPASPDEDPAFQGVIRRVRAVAERQGHNTPAQRRAAEAQAAAAGPPNEVASQAAAAQVDRMDAQEPQPFDRASFKAALLAKIAEITPQNLEQADEFKDRGAAAAIKSEVTANVEQGKEQAQGPIQQTTAEAPDPSVGQPKPVTPLPPIEAGPPPPDVAAAGAAPKPKTDAEVSLDEGSRSIDDRMSEANVTEEQLANANEPAFSDALTARRDAQTHAEEAPRRLPPGGGSPPGRRPDSGRGHGRDRHPGHARRPPGAVRPGRLPATDHPERRRTETGRGRHPGRADLRGDQAASRGPAGVARRRGQHDLR
jgi:hypothetical protein